jgi:uncharacterized protein (DUF58 family)
MRRSSVPSGPIRQPVLPATRFGRVLPLLRALASYDVFPEFSRHVRRLLYNPLGVLILAALVALLCGLVLHPQGFVLAGSLSFVLVLGIVWPWFSLRGLVGSLAFGQPRAVEGDRVEVCLTLRNRLPWGAWGLAVRGGFGHEPEDGKGRIPPVAGIAQVQARRTTRYRWDFVPPCRGEYPRSASALTTGFPFGLWETGRAVTVETPLLVWPRTFPVGPAPVSGPDAQITGSVSRNQVGSHGDVLGVRPYRRGDSPRRIHWAQSARHDRLIVCELQADMRPVVQLVLDADPSSHTDTAPDGSREWAIRIVASLAQGWLEEGAQVGAVWGGQVVPAASGHAQLQKLLDGLARLSDARTATLEQTLALPACRGFRDGVQVIVTTDRTLALLGKSIPALEGQRWVVLRTAAFCPAGEGLEGASTSELPMRPWLDIDAVGHIPSLLRAGWREARHGS